MLPALAELEARVRALPAEGVTEVFVHHDALHEGTYLCIAGGVDGRYLVFISSANEVFDTVVAPDAPEGEVDLVLGRQPGSYKLRNLVDLDSALTALRHYYDHQSPSPALRWENS